MKVYTQEKLAELLNNHSLWLNGSGGVRANLSHVDLSYADLSHVDLSYANLSYANLRSANLSYANLRSADLSYADLRSADLRSADLSYANLRSANLSHVNVSHVDLSYANLRSADLSYANLSYADLSYADLSYADLRYAVGNMVEIKSIHVDRWPIVYTTSIMAIGCNWHPITDWWEFDNDAITKMAPDALDWWLVWKPILQTIIANSPA